jgi:hypothetical protein
MTLESIDEEWENFITSNPDDSSDEDEEFEDIPHWSEENDGEILYADISSEFAPKPSDLYVSTKTKIAYLNRPMDLKTLFWQVPVIAYSNPCNGVIKKQMKFNSIASEEVDFIKSKLVGEKYFEEFIISHIDNPGGRLKYKDTRKVSIGLSKKDILSYRCKQKSAFYNCFVIILRMKIDNTFKEFHVKVFNTGKLEIPGIQNEETFELILKEVIKVLQPYVEPGLDYKPNTNITVLINSNFN